MKLEAVTISVNYSDFLEHVIEENIKLFDKWVIVTDTKDSATKVICDKFPKVTCIQTDIFYENNASFNKYAGINEGLKYISPDAWTLFIDSDILLMKDLRYVLSKLDLDETCLYGIDRLNCIGPDKYEEFKQTYGLIYENWLLTPQGLEIGCRLVHYYGSEGENGRFCGWNPLGFFQLAHRTAFDTYPCESKSADHCDLVFARLWPRSKRVFIPEVWCIHLESEGAKKAINWWGRKSQPFILKKKLSQQLEKEIPVIIEKFEKEESIILNYIFQFLCWCSELFDKIKTFIKNLFSKNKNYYYGN